MNYILHLLKRKYIHIVLSEDINIFVFYERCLHVHVSVFIQETEEIIGNRLDLCYHDKKMNDSLFFETTMHDVMGFISTFRKISWK